MEMTSTEELRQMMDEGKMLTPSQYELIILNMEAQAAESALNFQEREEYVRKLEYEIQCMTRELKAWEKWKQALAHSEEESDDRSD